MGKWTLNTFRDYCQIIYVHLLTIALQVYAVFYIILLIKLSYNEAAEFDDFICSMWA